MKDSHTQVEVDELPQCSFCKENGINRDAEYDGQPVILATAWANMCQGHWDLYGRGLGLGKGQKLVKRVQ